MLCWVINTFCSSFLVFRQGKRSVKLRRFRGWLRHWHYKGSAREFLTRRKESLRQRQRQLITRSFSLPGWRSSASAAARAWLRRDPGCLLPQSLLLLQLRLFLLFWWAISVQANFDSWGFRRDCQRGVVLFIAFSRSASEFRDVLSLGCCLFLKSLN